MSGTIFPTITHTGAQPIYGTGSGGSGVSSFSVLSASSITASTIATGNLVASGAVSGASMTAPNGNFAVEKVGLIYTSSISGQANRNTSTLLNSFTAPGLYTLNLNCTTTLTNGFGVGGSFVVGQNANNSNYLYCFPVGFTDNSSTYTIALDQANGGSGGINAYFVNISGIVDVPYNGTYTRLGF